jgi:hypothetical protein
MKKITFLAFLILPAISFAQIDFGGPTATARGGAVTATAKDWEAIGINPANLGWSNNNSFSLSVANIGINIQDQALTIHEVRSTQFDSLTQQQRQQAYEAMTTPGGMNAAVSANFFSFSIHNKKWGGLAISLTDHAYAHMYFSPSAAKIITDLVDINDSATLIKAIRKDSSLLRETPAQLLDGTTMGGYHYRELNIDYGHKLLTINIRSTGKGGASFENSEYLNYSAKTSDTVSNPLEIFGGFGIKPIWGIGQFSSIFSGGQNIEEGTYVYNSDYLSKFPSNLFQANGRGFGLDLGLNASYKKWKLGVSVTDIGSIKWQNIDFITTPLVFPTNYDSLRQHVQGNGKILDYFFDQSPGPDYTTQLPTKFRLGVSYKVSNGIQLASDFVAPLNSVPGNLLSPYVSVGAQVNVFHYIELNLGFATEKGFNYVVPAGVFVNFIGGIDFYVGTNDVTAFLNNESGHVLSLAAGIRVFGF